MTDEEIENKMKQLRMLLHKQDVMICAPKEFESHLTEADKILAEENHVQLIFS